MKKLALAIGFGAYIVFSSSASSLAAHRADGASGVGAVVSGRIWAETGTNPQLLFVNERLYPDTPVRDTDTTFCSDGNCISR